MPRYRVGDRVFETHQEAATHRDSIPDAPAIFVEPDEAPVDAYALVAKSGAARGSNAPWIAVALVFAVEIVLRFLVGGILFHGAAPPVGACELLSDAVELGAVWWVASVLSNPASHGRGVVAFAGVVAFFTALGLAAQLVVGIWFYRRVAAHERELAALQAAPAQGDAPPLPAPAIAMIDAGRPRAPRPWTAFSSNDGYRISFPGRPVVRGGRALVEADDGATFDVEVRALEGRTSLAGVQRTVREEVAALATRSRGAVLDEREHVDAPTRLAERLVRIALPGSPPRALYARIVATRGQLWVATAVLPASDPDDDAATFLESLDVTH